MPYIISKSNQDRLLEAAATLTQSEGWFKDAVAFAAKNQETGSVDAIAVFQNFRAGGAEFHFALVGKPMSNSIIKAYLFTAFHPKALNLRSLDAHIVADNSKAQRAALGVGFKFQYVKPKAAAGGADCVVMRLDREEREGTAEAA